MRPNINDIPLRTPLDFFKTVCFVCGETFWFRHKCKSTPQERSAYEYVTQRQREAREAMKRGKTGSAVGLGLKDCPICHGTTGNWNCRLCDGSGKVPDNVL